jgi:hypothetical protein
MRNLIFLFFFIGCILLGQHGKGAPALNSPGVQLSVELRDGSRVIGDTMEDTLSFHSATLGDMKLRWSDIHTIEYGTETDAAHLTASNGDSFTVQLSADALHLKTEFGDTKLPMALIRSIKVSLLTNSNGFAASGATNKTGLLLAIDLRDGSHLVGKALDDAQEFHSSAMGDLKLTWKDIRSIDYPVSSKDSAQLTATNGDVYEVQFAKPTVRVETSFGKTELPVKSISRINVLKEGDSGEHLIGWWKLDEGSGTVAKDSSSSDPSHDGILINGPTWVQSSGEGKWSLQFNGVNQYVSLGNIIQGGYSEFSIACWVKHVKSTFQIFIERHIWDQPEGIALIMTNDSNGSVLFGHFMNNWVQSKAAVQDGRWHHIVGTISPSGGGSGSVYTLYVDGKLDNAATISEEFMPASHGLDWSIGARDDGAWAYNGMIGDVRIYDRAISAPEVQAVYAEQQHGSP